MFLGLRPLPPSTPPCARIRIVIGRQIDRQRRFRDPMLDVVCCIVRHISFRRGRECSSLKDLIVERLVIRRLITSHSVRAIQVQVINMVTSVFVYAVFQLAEPVLSRSDGTRRDC